VLPCDTVRPPPIDGPPLEVSPYRCDVADQKLAESPSASTRKSTMFTLAALLLPIIVIFVALRNLQTFTEIRSEDHSPVIFPMLIDIVKPFLDLVTKDAAAAPSTNGHKVPAHFGPG